MKYCKHWKILLSLTLLLVVSWLPTVVNAQASEATVGVFDDREIPQDVVFEIPVEVRDVEGLYAIDLEIGYDPAVLGFEDADPATQGIQAALGQFLDAGLVVYNEVDEQNGVIRFAMTQVNPSEPKSGSGVLLVLYARGLTEGETELVVNYLALSTREGVAIDASAANSVVTVSSAAPPSAATSIPVQDPGSMIMIPTLAPTPTPTNTPTITPEPTKTPEPTRQVEAEQPEIEEAPVVEEAQKEGFSLRDNWWLFIVIFLPLLAGGGWYLLKRNHKG